MSPIIEYASFFDGHFDPREARSIANEVITAFARKAIIAGHDLFVLEGHPDIARQVIDNLAKEACADAVLKDKVEKAYSRILDFKKSQANTLRERGSDAWLKAKQPELEKLFYEIYPRLNNPVKPCRDVDLKRSGLLLNEIGRCMPGAD